MHRTKASGRLAAMCGMRYRPRAMGKPTKKQQRFVEEYLVDLNATQAAIRAGYSVKTANRIASENLVKVGIQEAIQEAMRARSERTKVIADDVVRELARLAFADMGDYVSWGPAGVRLKDSSELPEGASIAVLEVSETTTKDGGTVKFKLHDKKGALDSLAKHLGMFIERKNININTNWRFTIGKGYVERDEWESEESEAPYQSPMVINGHTTGELPPAVGAE